MINKKLKKIKLNLKKKKTAVQPCRRVLVLTSSPMRKPVCQSSWRAWTSPGDWLRRYRYIFESTAPWKTCIEQRIFKLHTYKYNAIELGKLTSKKMRLMKSREIMDLDVLMASMSWKTIWAHRRIAVNTKTIHSWAWMSDACPEEDGAVHNNYPLRHRRIVFLQKHQFVYSSRIEVSCYEQY